MMVRVVFGGDVMLGRGVADRIERCSLDYPLGAVAGLMRQADLAVVNLECAVSAAIRRWSGAPKAYYFRAPPAAARALAAAGVGLASLANNHVLDYGVRGLRDTIDALDREGIAHAGAGTDRDAALAPALVERHGIRFGMAAFCDHQRDFAAAGGRPGIAWLDLEQEAAALDAFERALAPLRAAGVDWPILSLHWGPNMVPRPSPRFRRLARGAVEMGWKIVYGHSAHVFQGIELHAGSPILYAAGDLVDDYAVDPDLRNDRQLLFELELEDGALRRILLHPVALKACRARPADAAQAAWTGRGMGELCAELGTRLDAGALPWTITPRTAPYPAPSSG
jgi:poly-gamma-glutamate synthesis protein (capsule biosynthesis protein)